MDLGLYRGTKHPPPPRPGCRSETSLGGIRKADRKIWKLWKTPPVSLVGRANLASQPRPPHPVQTRCRSTTVARESPGHHVLVPFPSRHSNPFDKSDVNGGHNIGSGHGRSDQRASPSIYLLCPQLPWLFWEDVHDRL